MKIAPKPTMALKLSVILTIFGMLIGYFSYITTTMVSSQNFTKQALTVLHNQIYENLKSDEPDIILKWVEKQDSNFLKTLKYENDPIHSIAETKLYVYNTAGNKWEAVDIDKQGKFSRSIFSESPAHLNMALKKKYFSEHGLFFGRSDTVSLMINLTRQVDVNKYILSLNFNRSGINLALKDHLNQFLAFGAVLLIVSGLLGKLFASRIVKTIRKLSEQSEVIASGDYSFRFQVKRRDEIGVLSNSLNRMASQIESHMAEIDRRIKTMETMNKIDKAVLSSMSRNDLLDRVIGIVSSLYIKSTVAIALRNEEKKGFDLLSVYGGGGKALLTERPFMSDEEIDPDLISKIPELFQYSGKGLENPLYRLVLKIMNYAPGTILHVPIHIKEKYLGSLLMVKDEENPFSHEEVQSLSMLADQVGVALQSVKAFEEKDRLFIGILMALSKAVDAKSKWTAGHSERVAQYAEMIGIKLQLDEAELRLLSISAILHDIGKIGVPENILDKPDNLTEHEKLIIRQHPQNGAEIIAEIPSHESILSGIVHHHEHWDGRGYPFGLKEYDIPLQGRIITVADVYDAITAERPYRSGMSNESALIFMKENSGRIFDPEIVDVFLNILAEEEKKSGDRP